MSVPPIPPPLHQIGQRPFSFYPAILGIEHNEWAYRKATWSEILVYNPAANLEVWIPRRLIGEVSRIDEPVVIVGLQKELEYEGGMVLPHERRVIEIPRAVNDVPRPAAPDSAEARPVRVTSIRLESGAESKVGRLLFTAIAIGILACVLLIVVTRDGGKRITFAPVLQNDLGFTGTDDYWSVVNKLGTPTEERWKSATGELQYRLLLYAPQNIGIVLMGPDRKDTRYIGAVDGQWRVVHSTNRNTEVMLKQLKRF